jgi:O-antigen biosynthesis protein WbqP
MKLRTKVGVHTLMPGLTGWAQINGRDEISLEEKVKLDAWYKENYSIILDVKIIFRTLLISLTGKGVTL